MLKKNHYTYSNFFNYKMNNKTFFIRVFYRNAKKNQEFNQFFSEFKKKNEGKWKSIINGMDLDEETLQQETQIDKKDEFVMLKEFEKRRKFKATLDIINNKEFQENGDNINDILDDSIRTKEKKDLKKLSVNPESIESALSADETKGEIFDGSKFNLIFLDADMVCNMTRLNRVYERRCLLYIGNKEGLVAYGIGRGPLYEDAYIDAYKQLKKNLIAIPIDPQLTCSIDLKARFNDYRIYIKSCSNPSLWGHHLMCLMLRYAGLYHVGFYAKSRKKEPYAMVFAFFKAITKNKTPLQTSEIACQKENRQYVSRGRKYEFGLSPVNPV